MSRLGALLRRKLKFTTCRIPLSRCFRFIFRVLCTNRTTTRDNTNTNRPSMVPNRRRRGSSTTSSATSNSNNTRSRGGGSTTRGALLQFCVVFTICCVLYGIYKSYSATRLDWYEVVDSLKANGLEDQLLVFKHAGIDTVEEYASLNVWTHKSFRNLPDSLKESIQRAALQVKDELILKEWLIEKHLQDHLPKLKQHGVVSLELFGAVKDETLRKVSPGVTGVRDYMRLKQSTAEVRNQLHGHTYHRVKEKQWKKALDALSSHKWSIGGIMFSLLVATLVLLVNMNYATYTQNTSATAKHSILEFVTGKYLAIQYCKVFWDWDEPQTVGRTMTFKIKFYQRNGRPYPISGGDNLLVEIMQGNTKVPPTIQHGGHEPSDVNSARVAFTVHRAGEYKISIMVGAKHIRGSPFIKKFQAGAIDPTKTGFVCQSSIVVCTKGVNHSLVLEPRDEYGNLCTYNPEADHKSNYKITVTESGQGKQMTPSIQITYEKATKRISMNFILDKEGCYQACSMYGGVKLKNGEFTILVLSENDGALVRKNVLKKSHNIWYEARLLTCNYDKQQKAKKVYIYISPKQLTVKEFYLKIFPKRLFTFRVCPSTKFQFLGQNNQYEAPQLVIEDGSQPPVELATKDRNIIAATFTNFLLKNIGGSETFKDKQDFFYHQIRQLHSKRLHDKLTIKVQRMNLLESSMKAIKHFSTSDWCKNFEIVFQGEEGLDWGGVRREWFELLCTEIFDPNCSGLFTRFKDDNQGLVHPNPARPPHLKTKYYEFAGKIVGKCLYESALGGSYRQLVKARLSRSFLAQLIGLRVNYKYFEQDDPELYVSKIRYIEENDVDDMEMVFAEEEYKQGQFEKLIELIPNGAKLAVTNKNKLRYLDALAQFRLATSVKEEIESFLKGLNELVPDNLLSIFDENELELLMCGMGNYCITEFKEHHMVSGSSPEFRRVLEWFWTIVSGFTREEMARLLQFTTGCSQLPPGGFAELIPKFQITAAPTYGNLPTAHTCFNQLCLPDYDSLEQLHQSLVLAINEGNQGFGMI